MTIPLIFVLFVNMMLFFANEGMASAGLDNTPSIYSCEKNIFGELSAGCNVTASSNFTSMLPELDSGNSPTGSSFRDFWSPVFSGLAKFTKYFFHFVTAFSDIMGRLNLPPMFTFGLNTLWYGIALFILLSWLLGR
jgi:hypothetical protein